MSLTVFIYWRLSEKLKKIIINMLFFRLTFSVRDLLTWVHFINTVTEDSSAEQTSTIDVGSAYVHGACLTFLDSLGSGLTANARYYII
jgi:midasin (ATPase involved in ribosome maturation)